MIRYNTINVMWNCLIIVAGGGQMKRITFFLIVMVLGISGCRKNYAGKVEKNDWLKADCVVSNHFSDGDYNLTIIANQDEIEDKEEYARMLIEKVQKNEFETIMFSYDMTGFPTGLQMTVYLSEDDWKNKNIEPYMEVFLEQDDFMKGYNIVDDYDKFTLGID